MWPVGAAMAKSVKSSGPKGSRNSTKIRIQKPLQDPTEDQVDQEAMDKVTIGARVDQVTEMIGHPVILVIMDREMTGIKVNAGPTDRIKVQIMKLAALEATDPTGGTKDTIHTQPQKDLTVVAQVITTGIPQQLTDLAVGIKDIIQTKNTPRADLT